MSEQNNSAAERSAHVTRGPSVSQAEETCYVCGGPFKGGASYGVRVIPPMVQVCSAVCSEDPRYANPKQGG